MSIRRAVTHFIFQALMALCLINYRFLAWKEYILLFMVLLAIILSYSSYGKILTVKGRWRVSVLQVLFYIVLVLLSAFPVADNPAFKSSIWFPGWVGILITGAIFISGILAVKWVFESKKHENGERAEGKEASGILFEFFVAVLLILIIITVLTVLVEWIFLPDNLRGAKIGMPLLLVLINSVILILVSWRVFHDEGPRPSNLWKILVPEDYRVHFAVFLSILCVYGIYATGRVLLAEWEAGEAFGAKDNKKAESALLAEQKYNAVLKLDALEKRTAERLGVIYSSTGRFNEATECYKNILAKEPGDVPTRIKMIQLEALKGNFNEANNYLNTLQDLKSDKSAINRLNGLLDCCPYYIDGQNYLGRMFLQAGDDARAMLKFQKVLEKQPENLIALGTLADLYEKLGLISDAHMLRKRMILVMGGEKDKDGQVCELGPFSECDLKIQLYPGAWRATLTVFLGANSEIPQTLKLWVDGMLVSVIGIVGTSPRNYEAYFRITEAGIHKMKLFFEENRSQVQSNSIETRPCQMKIESVMFRYVDK